jgi:hypothetical protein
MVRASTRERERDERISAGLGRFEEHNTLLPWVAFCVWMGYRLTLLS